jgi:Recombination, repair and ssDNA binding protein UvsY
MKLESIFELWEQDSKIQREVLDDEALKISTLHHKYHKIYTQERLILRKHESELKVLKLEKFEFFTMGPTQETHAKGWKLPAVGKVIRSDCQQYIDADKDIIELTLKIGIQHEKIELLESILKTINNRGFQIKTAVDWIKFTSGS